MKTTKRIICLAMAVIMLITGTPALQAGEAFNLDKTQMKELRQDILQDLNKDILKVKDPVKELMARYQQAKKNAEARLQEINKVQLTEDQQKAAEEHVNQLKEKAEELAKTEEYVLYVPKPERQAAAFNGILLTDILLTSDDLENYAFKAFYTGVVMEILGLILIYIEDVRRTPKWFKILTRTNRTAGFLIIAEALFVMFVSAYTPMIAPSLGAEETCELFSEKPFYFLAKFDEQKEAAYNEFANMYGKCPQALQDAVLIEEVVSANPNSQNMKEKLYIGSLGWYKDSVKDRTDYLHNFAERLRVESKMKTSKFSKKVGLEEK